MEIPRDILSRQNRDGEVSDILFTLIIALSDNCGSQTRPREFNETTWKKKSGKSTSSGCSFFRLFIVEKTSLALNVALTGRGYLLLSASFPGGESLSWRTLGEKVFTSVPRESGEEKSRYIILRERFALERLTFSLFFLSLPPSLYSLSSCATSTYNLPLLISLL